MYIHVHTCNNLINYREATGDHLTNHTHITLTYCRQGGREEGGEEEGGEEGREEEGREEEGREEEGREEEGREEEGREEEGREEEGREEEGREEEEGRREWREGRYLQADVIIMLTTSEHTLQYMHETGTPPPPPKYMYTANKRYEEHDREKHVMSPLVYQRTRHTHNQLHTHTHTHTHTQLPCYS